MEEINNYFNTNYDELVRFANNCLKQIKRQDLKFDLVTALYFYLSKNEHKIDIKNLKAITTNWMNKQVLWPKSHFKEVHIYKKQKFDYNLSPIENIGEYDADEEVYLEKEKEIQSKLAHIYNTYANLKTDKKILYDNVFSLGYNTSPKLSKYTGIPVSSCWLMVKDLKQIFINTYNQNEKTTPKIR